MEDESHLPAGEAMTDNKICLIVIGMAGSGKTTFVQVILC